MVEKIVIFGGTGFLGKRLIDTLKNDYQIVVATRNADANLILESTNIKIEQYSNNVNSFTKIIEGSQVVVNFAGASIADKRWSNAYKKIVYDSRVNTTSLISEAIGNCINKPHTFVSTSATGVYGDRGDELLYEDSDTGNDFLADLCKDWEKAALKSVQFGVKAVCIRTGVVLDKKDGGFRKMMQPFKLFVGGTLGNGKQYLPWIHVNDIINIYREAIINKSLKDIVNGTAPNPVTNIEFSKTLGKALKRPSIFNVPEFALKIIVGEFAGFLIGSQRAIPKKLLDLGFGFEYKEITAAIENILK
jgi:hypothetical protein